MKIFNKERYNQLKGNRFARYLAYAFGEIILVIIGILFALGINNWNQKNQLKKTNIDLQKKVLMQLDKDIKSIEAFQNEIEGLNNAYMKILGRDYDKSKVSDGSVISTVLFDVNTLSLDQQMNNLIDNAKLDDSKSSEEIINIRSNYKLYLKDIDDIEKIIYEKMTTNLTEIEKTQSWYSELITDFTCRNDCINYLLKDEGHKSRIASLRFLYVSGYGNIIKGFRDDLELSKKDLEQLISE